MPGWFALDEWTHRRNACVLALERVAVRPRLEPTYLSGAERRRGAASDELEHPRKLDDA